MSILKIARMGHPVLRARARPLHPSEIRTPKIQQLIDDMFETMKEYQGVGLAAPQVHEGLRIFVAGFPPRKDGDEDDEREDDMPLMAINFCLLFLTMPVMYLYSSSFISGRIRESLPSTAKTV